MRLLRLFGAEAAPSFYLFIVFVCVAALVLLVDTVAVVVVAVAISVVVAVAVVADAAAVIKYCTCLRHSWHHSTFFCCCRLNFYVCLQVFGMRSSEAKDFDFFLCAKLCCKALE